VVEKAWHSIVGGPQNLRFHLMDDGLLRLGAVEPASVAHHVKCKLTRLGNRLRNVGGDRGKGELEVDIVGWGRRLIASAELGLRQRVTEWATLLVPG
jgi:hypothetical protein